jgi:large subunit ribosomal protein L6
MILGVTKGFIYKLKMVYAHFPMSVKVEDAELTIENFNGERKPRKVKVPETVTISVVDDDIIVKGLDLEEVSQTAANIQQATRIKNKDPRVFLDGIYVYEKGVEI